MILIKWHRLDWHHVSISISNRYLHLWIKWTDVLCNGCVGHLFDISVIIIFQFVSWLSTEQVCLFPLTWPQFLNLDAMAPWIARSISAFSKTIKGALPPSSSPILFTPTAHWAYRSFPTSVEPEKCGCDNNIVSNWYAVNFYIEIHMYIKNTFIWGLFIWITRLIT